MRVHGWSGYDTPYSEVRVGDAVWRYYRNSAVSALKAWIDGDRGVLVSPLPSDYYHMLSCEVLDRLIKGVEG